MEEPELPVEPVALADPVLLFLLFFVVHLGLFLFVLQCVFAGAETTVALCTPGWLWGAAALAVPTPTKPMRPSAATPARAVVVRWATKRMLSPFQSRRPV